jgi:hypothetical protein
MTVLIYKSTWYHNPENNSFYNHRHNLGPLPPKLSGVLGILIYEQIILETGKIGLNKSFVYVHPFPHSQPNFFASIHINSQKNYRAFHNVLRDYKHL